VYLIGEVFKEEEPSVEPLEPEIDDDCIPTVSISRDGKVELSFSKPF